VKLGTENRNKVYIAGGLSVVAIALFANFIFNSNSGPRTPATTIATTVVTKGKNGKGPAPRSLDPTLRYDWLKASENTQYEGHGRDIFSDQAEIPTPVAPAITEAEKEAQLHPPPPPPPPINLKFFGFENKPGSPKKVFLSQGEDVFIAAEGDIVDRRYKVIRISPASVEIEDVLNSNRQSIPLTQS